MHPMFSLDHCPVCGEGLCGIRICGLDTDRPHGLVVCDECEALWLQPDLKTPHQYPDSRDARCPTCHQALWSSNSRWADWEDVLRLGWQTLIDPGLVWDDVRVWEEPQRPWVNPTDPPASDRSELA